MGQEEGKKQADAFYRANLPLGMVRYVGCGWRSLINAQAEFCFEHEVKGKREYVCIVLYEKQLTGSQEDLDRVLRETLEPSFHDYQPCERDHGCAESGHDIKGPRPWRRDN